MADNMKTGAGNKKKETDNMNKETEDTLPVQILNNN